MGLTSILLRHKPQCSIEVGTYKGGSLSLLAQLSAEVYSIDIDPEVCEKFSHFQNVRFLTGDSGQLLPTLLRELTSKGVGVDFLLIDGDHSAEGVLRDLNSVLDYIPLAPMFVVTHDSFNPDCRRGMLAADWQRSAYCHWVDLDFVPGRRVEHGGFGTGEMWGGLAAAFFHPTPRSGLLTVGQTGLEQFELVRSACYASA